MKNTRIFEAIKEFITDLNEAFGDDEENLQLKIYNHFISKEIISKEKTIKRHISAFKNFFSANKDAMVEKDIKKIVDRKIVYSDKVFIDMYELLDKASSEEEAVIWSHLLTIWTMIDPTDKAKNALKESASPSSDFLTNMISKVEKSVGDNTDPMAAMSSIMSSGLFTELLGDMNKSMESGDFDINNLMSSVQTMMSSMGQKAGVPSDTINSHIDQMNGMAEFSKSMCSAALDVPPTQEDTSKPVIEEVEEVEEE